MQLKIVGDWKIFRGENYNYNFNMKNGFTEVWGKTKEEDPTYSPFGPIIADIEIGTICHGINNIPCPFCYKANTPVGDNMSFETFKIIFDKFPKYNGIVYLHQIAFGVSDIDSNKDLFKMMEYCRENYVIPNLTINGDRLTDEIVTKLASLAGACSVSFYGDKDICYGAIEKLGKAGLNQINIHQLVSDSTYDQCFTVMNDSKSDSRLKYLNAIVFLSLKQKGRGVHFNRLPYAEYKEIITYALDNNINFGSDSCGCSRLAQVMEDIGKGGVYNQYFEPCESLSGSFFCDVFGISYPCSFATESSKGIDLTTVNDFLKEVWYNEISCSARKEILSNKRDCIYFDI